jgi:hypothetical protein
MIMEEKMKKTQSNFKIWILSIMGTAAIAASLLVSQSTASLANNPAGKCIAECPGGTTVTCDGDGCEATDGVGCKYRDANGTWQEKPC